MYWKSKWKTLLEIQKRDGENCFYCGREFIEKYINTGSLRMNFDRRITIDHKVPRKRGGTNNLNNIVVCCFSCNAIKKDKTDEEFGEWLVKTANNNNFFL